MAMDRYFALGARLCSGAPVCVGLRTDGPRYACARSSAGPTSCRGVLSIRTEPDVCRLLHWIGRALGGLRPRELARLRGSDGRCARRRPTRAAVRGASSVKDVRGGV
jgi:hypothetical protein